MHKAAVQIICRERHGELLGELYLIDRRGEATLRVTNGDLSISEFGDYVVRFEKTSAAKLHFAPPIESLPTTGSSEIIGLLGRPPGLGLVRIELTDTDGELKWRRDVAVRPEKLRDRAEFEQMVGDLCRWRTGLALNLHAHSSAPWVLSDTTRALTAEERLVVLRAAIEDNQLFENLSRVERSALVRLSRDAEKVIVGQEEIDPFRFGHYINGPGVRTLVPASHPLAVRISSFPTRLPPARKIETVDTPENQFVKVALRRFRMAISDADRELPHYSDSPLVKWAREAERRLASAAGSPFFSKISWPAHVALGSPALQRREAYRSILQAFLDLRAGFSMPWDEMGRAVFGETRDVPTIYEFWCLLRLREGLESEFGASFNLDHFLVASNRLSVRRGSGSRSSRPVSLRRQLHALTLHYNRTFYPINLGMNGGFRTHGSGIGTWSKPMKPDFTVALHPDDLTESQAAEQRSLRLVHFDAKYRLGKLIAGEATHQPDDLDKMHAYTASINHSCGSYALFPGDAQELLAAPTDVGAVGAIPLAPGRSEGLGTALRLVLEKAIAF